MKLALFMETLSLTIFFSEITRCPSWNFLNKGGSTTLILLEEQQTP